MNDKMSYRVSTLVKAPTWQSEHKARQYRLILAIDENILNEFTAEYFDAFDNYLRYCWVNACVPCLVCTN